MKRSTSKTLAMTMLSATLAGGVLMQTPQAFAATTQNQKTIQINGQQFETAAGIVSGGTTYMPIWYVMQALKKLGITSQWTGSAWEITAQASATASSNPGTGKIGLYLNGDLLYKINGIAAKDPASGTLTTYIPVYYIMKILATTGVPSTWDGVHWNIESSVASGTGTLQSISSFTGATTTPNDATDDTSYWQRASSNFYVSAETDDPAKTAQGAPILYLAPGQTAYLMAYSDTQDINSATWQVNSPYGQIGTGDNNVTFRAPNNGDNGNGYIESEATFTASKPGIYTIQAQSGGQYSVPLVVTVGIHQLEGNIFAPPSASAMGIEPFASNVPAATEESMTKGTTYYDYGQAINGWLPIKGSIAAGSATHLVVDLQTVNGNSEWNYTIPVNADGTYSAMVRDPFTGDVNVMIVPKFFNQLTTTSGKFVPVSQYVTTNDQADMSEMDMTLLASAAMDYNMSPEPSRTLANQTVIRSVVSSKNLVHGNRWHVGFPR